MTKMVFDSDNQCIYCYDPICKQWRQLLRGQIENGSFHGLEFRQIEQTPKNGKFIIPGFIDAHCHLLEYPYPRDTCESFQTLPSIALYNALLAAKSGITSLKDMGGHGYKAIEIIKMLESFKIPRLFSSGCYFTVPGGHCADHGAIEINALDDFIRALKPLIDNEITFCKIINSDDGFSYDLLSQMIHYAHSMGMIVSCHAFTEKAARVAVLAGTDTLEHAGDYSDELIDLILKNDVVIVPTYVSAVDSTPKNCEEFSDVNDSVLQEWIDGENKVIPKLFEKKVKVALGTDSGFLGTPCDSLLREVQLLHTTFKIPIEELLYSAFIITPLTVGMEGRLGMIENGYFADCLCYGQNPLEDINILINPNETWVNGKRIDNTIQAHTVIKKLKPADISLLSAHMRHFFFDCADLDDFWTDDEIGNWLNDPNDYCTGAFYNGVLIGFCLTHHHITANKVHIENVFVDERYRKNGIAHLLVFDAISHYRSKFAKVRFVGIVEEPNDESISLFLKSGFSRGKAMIWMQNNSYEQI